MSKPTIILLTLFLIIVALVLMQVTFNASPLAISIYLLAQIGVSVSVEPNPFNTLAGQLQEKEEALLEKEGNLIERENFLTERTMEGRSKKNSTLIYLLAVAGVLLILILLNFYLDYRRKS